MRSRTAKILDRFVKWAMAFALAVAAVVGAFVLAPDLEEDLLPAAAGLLEQRPAHVPANDNLYFALVGFWLADDPVNINKAGQRLVAGYQEATKRRPEPDEFVFANPEDLLVLDADSQILCDPPYTTCLRAARRYGSEIAAAVVENHVLVRRYFSLYRYQHYANTAPPRYWEPLAHFPGEVRDLVRTWVALDWVEGRREEALRRIEDDTLFWRSLLGKCNDLFCKLVAISSVRGNLLFLAELVADDPTFAYPRLVARRLAAPLSDQERDLTSGFAREFGMYRPTVIGMFEPIRTSHRPVKRMIGRLLDRLLSVNGTINFQYLMFRDAMDLATATSIDFDDRRKALLDHPRRPGVIAYLTNPIGSLVLSKEQLDYSWTIARIHDLEGLTRLVRIQLDLVSKRISSARVADYLASTPENLRDPYTGQAMGWDPGVRTVYFRARGARKDVDRFLEVHLSLAK